MSAKPLRIQVISRIDKNSSFSSNEGELIIPPGAPVPGADDVIRLDDANYLRVLERRFITRNTGDYYFELDYIMLFAETYQQQM